MAGRELLRRTTSEVSAKSLLAVHAATTGGTRRARRARLCVLARRRHANRLSSRLIPVTRLLPFKDAETVRVAAVSPIVFGYAADGICLPDERGHDNLHAELNGVEHLGWHWARQRQR